MSAVTSRQIEAYFPVIDKLASQIAASGVGRRAMAEYDDLFQEGSISVWQALEKGVEPSAETIRFRMLSWVRYLKRHEGESYEEVLEQGELVPGSVQ